MSKNAMAGAVEGGDEKPNPANLEKRWKVIAAAAVIVCAVLTGFLLGSFRWRESPVQNGAPPVPQLAPPVPQLAPPVPPIAVVVQPPTIPTVQPLPQQQVRNSEMEAFGKFLGALSEFGKQGPGTFQPASVQHTRQQCLACSGTGNGYCSVCRGQTPKGGGCPGSLPGFQHPGCRTCGGSGWR